MSMGSFRLPIQLLRLVVATLLLLPLVWMVAAAFHAPGTPLPQSLRLLPEQPSGANFARVGQLVPLGRYAFNSLLVTSLAVPLTIVTASWAGFAMAQLPNAVQRKLVFLSLAVLLVPAIALWSPRFLIYKYLGLLDTFGALIAPAVMGTSPFYVLMFYRAFRRIPTEIYDTARLDGAGVLRTWACVALPIARPTAAGVIVLSGALYWGDFLGPLLYLGVAERATLPVALQLLAQMSRSDWPLLMAAATLTTAGPVILFLLLQFTLIRKT